MLKFKSTEKKEDNKKKNVLYESSHEIGSMSWELGTTAILYRINKSSKHYEK